MGVILKGVPSVPWGKLHAASGTAERVPNLLSTLAWGKESAAIAALEELQFSIFRDGLAVTEATEHAIPFLWEIAEVRRGVVCVEIIRLLDCILVSRSWGKAYADAPRRYAANYIDKVAWERHSHRRVCGGLDFVRTLRDSGDEEVAQVAALVEEHIMTEIVAAD